LQNPKNEVVLQKLPKGWLSKLIGGAFFLDELTRLPEVFRNFLLDHLDVHHIQCIAALNPCACGMHGHRERPCTCSSTSFDRYQRKLPTPFRERFDLRINCQPEAWEGVLKEETSAVVRLRTTAAWERQINRQGKQNALLSYQELLSIMAFTKSQLDWLHRKFVLMKSSPREQLNGLRVALTLADLANEEPALCHVQQVFDEQVEGAEGGSPKPLEKRVVKIGTIIARG
jgi:hypothetical protein